MTTEDMNSDMPLHVSSDDEDPSGQMCAYYNTIDLLKKFVADYDPEHDIEDATILDYYHVMLTTLYEFLEIVSSKKGTVGGVISTLELFATQYEVEIRVHYRNNKLIVLNLLKMSFLFYQGLLLLNIFLFSLLSPIS